jgi:hypothetical protein
MVPSTLRSGRSASGKLAVQGYIHGHRALLDGGVDAHHAAVHDAVAGVDAGGLPHREVARLRLRNPKHCAEPPRVGDPREHGPRGDPLSNLQRKLLQHALRPGPHLHGGGPLLVEGDDRPQAVHLSPLHPEPRTGRAPQHRQLLLCGSKPLGELLGAVAGSGDLVAGDQLALCELTVRLRTPPRLTVFGAQRGHCGFLGQPLRLQLSLEIHHLGLRLTQLPLRIERLQLHVRIGQHEEERVGLDLVAGLRDGSARPDHLPSPGSSAPAPARASPDREPTGSSHRAVRCPSRSPSGPRSGLQAPGWPGGR